nr:DUF3258 domain-containing protein [Shewanella sp. UCD-FRSSP16_17]
MLKQLAMSDIDGLVAELEQGYSNHAHAVNVLGQDSVLDKNNKFITELAYISQAEDNDTRTIRLKEVIAGLSEAQKWPFMEALSSMTKLLVSITDDVDEDGVTEFARQLLLHKGFEAEQSSLAFRVLVSKLTTSSKLKNELVNSIADGDATSERELQQLLSPAPIVQAPTPITQVEESSSPLFSEVYEEFITHKINKEKLSTKMQKDYARRYAVWKVLVEDKPIDQYKPKDIGQFIDTCFELPKMHLTPYNKMTWEQRLSCDVPEEDMQASKSVHQYYKWLQSVFAYAKRDTIGYIETSPCSIKRNFSTNVRGIFNDAELKKLIEAAEKEKTKWKKWIIYLAIYTGARLGELAQLRKSDLKLDAETGRYYLLITDSHESQQLKTENAKRKIPVHHDLVNAGLIEHVQACNERVFDELTSPRSVTSWLPRQRDSLEIEYLNELGHMRTFHSFRHTFITKLMNVESMNINLLQQVVGHEISKFGVTSNYTHKLDSLRNLVPVVDAYKI